MYVCIHCTHTYIAVICHPINIIAIAGNIFTHTHTGEHYVATTLGAVSLLHGHEDIRLSKQNLVSDGREEGAKAWVGNNTVYDRSNYGTKVELG